MGIYYILCELFTNIDPIYSSYNSHNSHNSHNCHNGYKCQNGKYPFSWCMWPSDVVISSLTCHLYTEHTSKLCGRFITHLFACPEYPPSSLNSQVKLSHFIAYALHCMKLHTSVTFCHLCHPSSLRRIKMLEAAQRRQVEGAPHTATVFPVSSFLFSFRFLWCEALFTICDWT